MGKALALAAVTFISLGTYYTASRNVSEIETRRRVSNSQYEAISRSSALAGLNVGRQNLTTTWSASAIRGEHQGGTYTVGVKILTGQRAVLESVGTIRNAGRMSENYAIRALLERRMQLPDNPPVWMQYAIATDSDLQFNGNVDVMITGDASIELNANVHTNGAMGVSGNAVDINGFGSYSNGSSGAQIDNAFDPNYNPTGLPTHYDADPVPIPGFGDIDYLNAVDAYGNPMVDDATTGPVSLSGNYDFGGTRENPYVWHITGDLNVTGNTTIEGYVHFVVDGNVELNGDLLSGESGYDGTESSIGVTTSGSFTLTGSQTIEAQILSGGDFATLKGTPTIRGSITAGGTVTLSGTPNIYYTPASAGLTQFWQNDFKYTYHVLGYHEQ